MFTRRQEPTIDGVAISSHVVSSLLVSLWGALKKKPSRIQRPDIYCRYIDDILIQTATEKDAERLTTHLQEASGLNFTLEKSTNDTTPYLDISVKQNDTTLNADVYTKPSNPGNSLSGKVNVPQNIRTQRLGLTSDEHTLTAATGN